MTIFILIFLISTISLLMMLWYRAWEIKKEESNFQAFRKLPPEIYFRQVEKIMLYLTKHVVQWAVLVVVKYWFTLTTKTKKWVQKNSPRIHKFFEKKETTNKTFVGRAILESKIKIRRVKEKIKKEHEDKD